MADAATASIKLSHCGLANGMKKEGTTLLSYGANDGSEGETMNKVTYIDIMFDGICKGCRHADLELESVESYYGEKFWAVICNHARACEAAMEKALREAERRTNEAGRTD